MLIAHVLVAAFADYLHDEDAPTTTHVAYAGVPLADIDPKVRGDILQGVAKRVMQERMGERAVDLPPGTCVNGAKRGRNSATCDFGLVERRQEVKSAQLKWDKRNQCWEAQWQNLKRDLYDDLLLVLYTPSGLYLFNHDHVFGVSTTGRRQKSAGGRVAAFGPCKQASIAKALEVIVAKMQSMFIGHVPFAELGKVVTTRGHDAYVGLPLADWCGKARGDVLERVAKRVMEEMVGERAVAPPSGTCVNGAKKAKTQAPNDFVLVGRYKEVKAALLCWDTHSQIWVATWQHIKHELHDDLLLVLYTPLGVFLYQHDGVFGVSTTGRAQEADGSNVKAYGPCKEPSIAKATEAILAKMRPMLLAQLTL